MTYLPVLFRVHRLGLAALVVTPIVVTSAALVLNLPSDAIYPDVPALGAAVVGTSATAAMGAALLAQPRIDAAEVTASRSLWPVRGFVSLGLYVGLAITAAIICLAAGSMWFFTPLTRDGLLVASVALGLSVVLPTRYTAPPVLGYALVCFFVGRGDVWWDVLLAHPQPTNVVAAVLLAIAGGSVYARYGARPVPPEDEL